MLSNFHSWLALALPRSLDSYLVWLATAVPAGVARRKFKKPGERDAGWCLWRWTKHKNERLMHFRRDFGRPKAILQLESVASKCPGNKKSDFCPGLTSCSFSTHVSHWEHMSCLSAFSSSSCGVSYGDHSFSQANCSTLFFQQTFRQDLLPRYAFKISFPC